MAKYICNVCGYIYDETLGDSENNIVPGTRFEDIHREWLCPLCAVGKEEFEEV